MAAYSEGTSSSDVAKEETDRLIASDKVAGTAVYNRQGERLGSVYNFMVDKHTGKVAYAVMSFGGFLGIGDSYHPCHGKASTTTPSWVASSLTLTAPSSRAPLPIAQARILGRIATTGVASMTTTVLPTLTSEGLPNLPLAPSQRTVAQKRFSPATRAAVHDGPQCHAGGRCLARVGSFLISERREASFGLGRGDSNPRVPFSASR